MFQNWSQRIWSCFFCRLSFVVTESESKAGAIKEGLPVKIVGEVSAVVNNVHDGTVGEVIEINFQAETIHEVSAVVSVKSGRDGILMAAGPWAMLADLSGLSWAHAAPSERYETDEGH